MKFHTVVYQLLTYLSIIIHVCALKSDQIIGDDRNVVTIKNFRHYNHHATVINKVYKNASVTIQLCGASFLTRQHIITTAHCLKPGKWPFQQYVALPYYDDENIRDFQWSRFQKISEAYVPVHFQLSTAKEYTFVFDIGIAKLKEELVNRKYPILKALKILDKEEDVENRDRIIGIGLNTRIGDRSFNLTTKKDDYQYRVTKYGVLSKEQHGKLRHYKCHKNYKICAYRLSKPYGLLTSGDSGGGLVDENDRLIGILYSSVNFLRIPHTPAFGFFLNTTFYKAFINRILSEDLDSSGDVEKVTYSDEDFHKRDEEVREDDEDEEEDDEVQEQVEVEVEEGEELEDDDDEEVD